MIVCISEHKAQYCVMQSSKYGRTPVSEKTDNRRCISDTICLGGLEDSHSQEVMAAVLLLCAEST